VVAVDTSKNSGEPEIVQLIPEREETLEHVTYVGGKFFAKYLKDAFTSVKEFTTSGAEIKQVELPGIGTANGFGGRPGDKVTYYQYTSFNTPPMVYKYETETAKTSLFFKPKVKFDPDQFTTQQVFVKSKDGTKVPLFIVYKKGVVQNGQNPTYLYGYGGFNIAMRPQFSTAMIEWMEMGGIYAQACLRGGGEYGKEWHEAGMKDRKQNVFDDFIACGEMAD
jgi:prolyl oligopeptidase